MTHSSIFLTDVRGSSGFSHFSKLFFHHFFFPFTMVIKRSGELRGKSAAFGDLSASSMFNYSAGVNSHLGNGSFNLGRNPWREAWKSMQVKIYTSLIASTDLWPQQMFTFLERLACKWWCPKAVLGLSLSLEACGASRMRAPCFISDRIRVVGLKPPTIYMHYQFRLCVKNTSPPPPLNTINTANEGRFRLNVDSPYREGAQSSEVRCPRAPLRGARRGRAWISFSTWACASWGQAPSSFAFTMPEEEGTFDSVSAHLLATAANIFGWAGDPTEWRADFAVANVSGTSRRCKYFLVGFSWTTLMLLCTRVPKLHVPAAELWKELVLDVHEASCHLDKHGRRCM